jgi:hypothetical protein
MLLDDRLNDGDRHALQGAAQAIQHVPDAATRHPASGITDVLSPW